MDEVAMDEVDQAEQVARLSAIRDIQAEMGWRWFIAECNQEVENIKELMFIASTDAEVYRLQGRYDALQQVINFEDLVDNMLAQAEEAPDASV